MNLKYHQNFKLKIWHKITKLFFADINRKRLFQLLNTFLIKSRLIFDHFAWTSYQILFNVRTLLLKSACFKYPNPKNQEGFRLVFWQVCPLCWYMKRQTLLSSWPDNCWSSWQYGLMLYRNAETLCLFRSIQTREMDWLEWLQNVVDRVLCIYFDSCWNSQ